MTAELVAGLCAEIADIECLTGAIDLQRALADGHIRDDAVTVALSARIVHLAARDGVDVYA